MTMRSMGSCAAKGSVVRRMRVGLWCALVGLSAAACSKGGASGAALPDQSASYERLALGSQGSFGLDGVPGSFVSHGALNDKRQIVGIRGGATSTNAYGQPYLFDQGTFYDIMPPGNDLDTNTMLAPQLNERGEIYFPSIRAQVGVLRSATNMWTRVSSGAAQGLESFSVKLADDGALYNVHSSTNVPYEDPVVVSKYSNGAWADLAVVTDIPSGSSDAWHVSGVNKDGTMVMTQNLSVTTGGNGLPIVKCWVQHLDGSRVDLLPLISDGWSADPIGINDLGQVAGTLTLGNNGFGGFFAFLYKDGDVFILGKEPAEAIEMNNVGDVLYRTLVGETILYLADGSKKNLTTAIPRDAAAFGLNDAKEIFIRDGADGVFLLVPKP